jgi:hypothetical protein
VEKHSKRSRNRKGKPWFYDHRQNEHVMNEAFPKIKVNIRYDDTSIARKWEKETAAYFTVHRIRPNIGAALLIGGALRNCTRVEHNPTDNEIFIEFN